MDELVQEFLVETKDSLEILDNELLALEQTPSEQSVIDNLFRVMHTIKGTCGFLGLSRLESVAHAGEDILDRVRDHKLDVTPEIISVLLKATDVIKDLVTALEETGEEPEGDDSVLIQEIRSHAEGNAAPSPEEKADAPATPKENNEALVAQKTQELEEKLSSKNNDGVPEDSDELQALFDATECLADHGGNSGNTPDQAKTEENDTSSGDGDNDELQALFDSTECLADYGGNPDNTPDQAKTEESSASSGDGDNDDLQALFDATECLLDVIDNHDAPPQSVETTAKEEPAPHTPPATPKPVAEKKPPASDSGKKEKPATIQSIRVNLDVLEDLMQQASELVLTRNQLLQLLRTNGDTVFASALQRLNHITTDIQEGVMKTRMQPVGSAWTKLPRIIRDLSIELGKKIELQMTGEDTELDRQLLDLIRDPLTHMVRNSADHGIEPPEDRVANGKPEMGTVELKAYQAGGYIIIEISDDGKGIAADFIRDKAIEKGLVSAADAEKMRDEEIFQFIFAPGFSTAEKVTSVSGRGVGMDVVKSNIEKISGTVELHSEVGKGSTFTIRIPLTLAIMSVLKVKVAQETYAIPQINVIEVVKEGSLSDLKIETVNDRPVLHIRGHLLSLVDLRDKLKISPDHFAAPEKASEDEAVTQPKPKESDGHDSNSDTTENSVSTDTSTDENKQTAPTTSDPTPTTPALYRNNQQDEVFIVICEVGGYHFGVIVDEVDEIEEIVVKPVSPVLRHVDIYAGCTILGHGSVIMILDPNNLSKSTSEHGRARKQKTSADSSKLREQQEASFVLFRAGDSTPKVVPLELLSRMEVLNAQKIETSRGMPVIQYRNDLMRIISIDPDHQIPSEGELDTLVFTSNNEVMGLVVDEILDIVKAPLPKKLSSNKEGYLGSIVIQEKTCDVIDISHYFTQVIGHDHQADDQDEKDRTKILLVDDSPFFRKFIPIELEKAGYAVMAADSAKAALSIIDDPAISAFDIIVTDIDMPGMSGVDLLHECRNRQGCAGTPVIALSAHSSDRIKNDEAETKGFDGYIPKTNHADLLELLRDVITQSQKASA
jgi:two-component system chemotaxis sensor kinase CheA